MEKKLKSWQGWLLFIAAMVIVFILGILAASVTERRAEVASVFNNKKVEITGFESRNEIYAQNYPREYETWNQTSDMSFHSLFNGNTFEDLLALRPNMVILWAGYPFAKDYNAPRGHKYALEDIRNTLRTGSPMQPTDGPQPATCWACKTPDYPRLVKEKGIEGYYTNNKWATFGAEVVNPIGCANCHDPATMELAINHHALTDAFERRGMDIKQATNQEMRSLVCAQCHVEYFMKGDMKLLVFPFDKGFTMEAMEEYYDENNFVDYIHSLSKTPIIKAQHPDWEVAMEGIHAQRGVACADCHLPYKSEGGVKFSDHKIMSPLAMIDRTCQVCHRESEETLRNNVYDRQKKVNEIRNRVETELAIAHIEAKFAWEKGATEAQMKDVLKLLRQAQWRWDFGVASHGAAFHAPQEIQRVLGASLDKSLQARMAISKVLAGLGYTADIPIPDISSKDKAQKYIGLDIATEKAAKDKFLSTIVPEWLQKAKDNKKLVEKI